MAIPTNDEMIAACQLAGIEDASPEILNLRYPNTIDINNSLTRTRIYLTIEMIKRFAKPLADGDSMVYFLAAELLQFCVDNNVDPAYSSYRDITNESIGDKSLAFNTPTELDRHYRQAIRSLRGRGRLALH